MKSYITEKLYVFYATFKHHLTTMINLNGFKKVSVKQNLLEQVVLMQPNTGKSAFHLLIFYPHKLKRHFHFKIWVMIVCVYLLLSMNIPNGQELSQIYQPVLISPMLNLFMSNCNFQQKLLMLLNLKLVEFIKSTLLVLMPMNIPYNQVKLLTTDLSQSHTLKLNL